MSKTKSSKKREPAYLPEAKLLVITKSYIEHFYPHCRVVNFCPSFLLSAYGYIDSTIFIPFSPPNESALSARINNDIKQLQTIKHPPTNLFYFIDGKVKFTSDELLALENQLSNNGYRVSINDENYILASLILSLKSPPNLKNTDLSNNYEILYHQPEIEENVIEDIFLFAAGKKNSFIEIPPIETKYIHLKPKLKENFVSENYREAIAAYNALWPNKERVEYFIKQNFHHYKSQFYSILGDVRSLFRNAPFNHKSSTDFPVQDPDFFNKAARMIIPDGKKSDPRYLAVGKSIVLFFFEYCDFGKKCPDDPRTLFTAYLENDNTD